MKTQEDFIREILEIKTAHPEYDIHFFIPSDEIGEEAYTLHRICGVEICPFYASSDVDEIFNDEQSIRIYMEEMLDGQENIDVLIDEWYKKEVKNAIIVYTEAEPLEVIE